MITAKEMKTISWALDEYPFSVEYVVVGILANAFQGKNYSEWGELDNKVINKLKEMGYKITFEDCRDGDVRIEW